MSPGVKLNEWHAEAACKGADTNLFFPGQGESLEPALLYCRMCPVASECLEEAFRNGERHGVYGGMSERDRRLERRRRRKGKVRIDARQPKPEQKFPPKARETCGSVAGYSAHRYYFEEPCKYCKSANARHTSGQKAARRAAAS